MSDTPGDPLYRSDTRGAPTGAQQADLAPVSDQPEEHWEQQAEAREAEEPAAPTDPLGAQPEPSPASPSGDDAKASSPPQQPAEEQQADTSAPAQAPPSNEPSSPSSDGDTGASESRDVTGAATFNHDTALTLSGEATWRDADGGEHARSGEITVDVSHATTLGGSLATAQSQEGVSGLQDGLSGLTAGDLAGGLAGAEAALSQAVSAAQGAVAVVHDAALSEVTDLTGALPANLDTATAPALDAVSAALDASPPSAEGLGTGLDSVTGALSDVSGAEPGGGLLAALFTPTEALDASPVHTATTDTLPDLDLGGLLGPVDDHPDIGLPGV